MKVRPSPAGIQLFNRTDGLNILLDEFSVPPGLWPAAPRYVSIALTNACELRCPYCYAPKHSAQLNIENLSVWLDELDHNGCLGVGFGGGEPTLHPDFAEICRYAAQRTALAVTFTTHGHRLDEKLLRTLAGNVHFVRVSMDGTNATYEALRGRSFAALRCRLAELRTIAPFGLNYVVNATTFPELDSATGLAAELGASEFLLLPEQPAKGRAGIDRETTAALSAWVGLYRGRVPLAVSEAGSEGLPTTNPLAGENGLRAHAHVSAAGILKRTSFHAYGTAIDSDGFIRALDRLRGCQEGDNQ
jgi:MoaA/NifB/PqqE/SkfB family radical SAM enzyme